MATLKSEPSLDTVLSTLIKANHILHHQRVLDWTGTVSVRNPDNVSTFFMSHDQPPALVAAADDLIEFKIEDGEPKNGKKIDVSERCIHSEIYKRFSAVNSIVHSHSADVLPYTASEVPLKPVTQTAGFLGTHVPVWDITPAYSSSSAHDLLVHDAPLGASLASAFTTTQTTTNKIYTNIRTTIIGGAAPAPTTAPDHPVVLMRGHGFTVTGQTIEEAVYQAYYTQEAAKMQTTALVTRSAYFGDVVEGKVDVEGGGKIKGGKVKAEGTLHYLSDKEAGDAWAVNRGRVQMAWRSWAREVECLPLYKNEVGSRAGSEERVSRKE